MKVLIMSTALFLTTLSIGQNSANELEKNSPDDSAKSVVSGFYNRVNVGVLGGSASSLSFNIINGYRFNQRWSAGLGLGVEQFNWNRYIPIFVEGNYNLLKSNTTPWLNLMVGYELPSQNIGPNRGGFTCGGKVGFSYFIAEHVGISTSIGYRYANLKDETNWWGWEDFVTITDINRYEFRVGVVFK